MSRVVERWTVASFAALFNAFKNEPDLMVLDSSNTVSGAEPYSYLCYRPFAKFRVKNGQVSWNGEVLPTQCPWTFLQTKLKQYYLKPEPTLPAFQGGALGFWGYELAHTLESYPVVEDSVHFPDCALNFYAKVFAYDSRSQEVLVISTGFPEGEAQVRHTQDAKEKRFVPKIFSNFTQDTYCQAVALMQNFIRKGDIFQGNLTQQFQATLPLSVDKAEWYLAIREQNAAPFSAYMQVAADEWLISCSPERFIRLSEGVATTQPIKGTSKRDKHHLLKDQALQQALRKSKKDRAENTMIVDLMRNDLSRVCQPGSVKVLALCELQTFESVHHLVSTIQGTLAPTLDAIDLLKASFPPGSVTGAPKLKAMECISHLEKTARGPYCGCLGYISFTGDMDTAVTIRSYMIKGERVFFSAGGAVVLGSDPQGEYEESLVKVKKLKEMLAFAAYGQDAAQTLCPKGLSS